MAVDTYVGDLPGSRVAEARLERATPASVVATSLCVVAAAVHAAVAPEHLGQVWVHGAFFVALGIAQALLAWLLLTRPSVAVVVAGLAGTVAVVLLYVASRTIGLPLTGGAAAGHAGHGAIVHQPIPGAVGPGVPVMPGLEGNPGVEAVGTMDLLALGAELGLVVALLAMLPSPHRRVVGNVVLALGAALWLAALLSGSS